MAEGAVDGGLEGSLLDVVVGLGLGLSVFGNPVGFVDGVAQGVKDSETEGSMLGKVVGI